MDEQCRFILSGSTAQRAPRFALILRTKKIDLRERMTRAEAIVRCNVITVGQDRKAGIANVLLRGCIPKINDDSWRIGCTGVFAGHVPHGTSHKDQRSKTLATASHANPVPGT